MRDVVILGSTGSIGTQAVEVIRQRPEQFGVTGLSAGGSSVELLLDQARELAPRVVAVSDPAAAAPWRPRSGREPDLRRPRRERRYRSGSATGSRRCGLDAHETRHGSTAW